MPRRNPSRRGAGGRAASGLRIIGGSWRGRRLTVLDRPGLRPTGDRVRETLFNWLQAELPGARCLDLFAGAGGLGFEAASRGAGDVVMIERDAGAARHLHQLAEALNANSIHVVADDALSWLARPNGTRFDVVFVDPPFASDLARNALRLLSHHDWLSPRAQVYLEHAARGAPDPLADAADAAAWEVRRDKTASEVRYRLLRATDASDRD